MPGVSDPKLNVAADADVSLILTDAEIVVKYRDIDSEYIKKMVDENNDGYFAHLDISYMDAVNADAFQLNRARSHIEGIYQCDRIGLSCNNRVKEHIFSQCNDYPWIEGFNDSLGHVVHRTFDYASVIPNGYNATEVSDVLAQIKKLEDETASYSKLSAEDFNSEKYFPNSGLLHPFDPEHYYEYMSQEEFDHLVHIVDRKTRAEIIAKVLSTYNMYHFGLGYLSELRSFKDSRIINQKIIDQCLIKLLYYMYKEEQIFKAHVTTGHRFVVTEKLFEDMSGFDILELLPILQNRANIIGKNYFRKNREAASIECDDITLNDIERILDDRTALTGSYLTTKLAPQDVNQYGDIDIAIKCGKEELYEMADAKIAVLESILVERGFTKQEPVKIKNKYQVRFTSEWNNINFEFFQIFNEPISLVARFHVPPVRAYRIKENGVCRTYMLPSACMALITGICLDLRYFASTTTPIGIIWKYISRSYQFLVSSNEMKILESNGIDDRGCYWGYIIRDGVIQK